MGAINAQIIIDEAEKTLFDETNIRWSATELLSYLNNASRHICMLKPDAYTQNAVIQMAASETKNSIPADGIRLKRPVRNMGSNGLTPGRVITWAPIEQLDKTNPSWHNDAANAEILHFLQDENDPKNFYVYPPQPAAAMGYAEIIYFATPPEVLIGASIPLDDVYKDAYMFYILSAAHSKETPEASPERAGSYYNLFIQAIGLKTAGENAMDSTKDFS